ncbi:uncharacterized protein LOC123532334 [Mercenaria mercenaria]|uniref:uncharacterized protein LOC123532334 n=1 Tax=Mercenaria mercenaria TaxID=6596 RepID=UPI00234E5890|nr:uncharacterized protein LOC123532334 [Mercenaria mercenaria]XP_053374311.1 uncharacterized protein LOC123532334 [Mercenaria mercenaria]
MCLSLQRKTLTKMWLSWLISFLVISRDVLTQTPHVCVGINECKCKFQDDDTVIDITSLGNTDGSPRFKDVLSKDGYEYSYNPCGPFTEFSCGNAAVCRRDRATGKTEMTGSAEMPQFTYDEQTGDTVIGYTAGALGNVHTFVYLMCDDSPHPGPPQFYPNGTMSENLYILTVYTACACGNRCDANGIIGQEGSTSSLGIGYIILIGVVCVALLYFVVGAAIMKFCKKATGKEVIPNSSFWCGLPGNVKRGCTVVCCRRNYEKM